MNVILLLLGIFTSIHVSAFTLNSSGDPSFRGWDHTELTFNVNPVNCPAGMDVPGLINDAVKVWNDVATSNVKISYNGSTTSATYGNPTTVYCETNFQATTGADQNYVPAAASIQTSGHYAVGGLLYLNVSVGQGNISRFDRTALLVIIAHEVGHILGLGHSQDASALMYFNATGKAHLTLSQDDIDGVSYLYPRNEFGGDQIMGCGLVAATAKTKPPPPGSMAILLLLMSLPVVVYLRLRSITGQPRSRRGQFVEKLF